MWQTTLSVIAVTLQSVVSMQCASQTANAQVPVEFANQFCVFACDRLCFHSKVLFECHRESVLYNHVVSEGTQLF